jgi:hypothetical protein
VVNRRPERGLELEAAALRGGDLLHRARLVVRAGCAFLAACAAGRPVADAAAAAIEAQADADLALLMEQLLAAGAFAAGEPS